MINRKLRITLSIGIKPIKFDDLERSGTARNFAYFADMGGNNG